MRWVRRSLLVGGVVLVVLFFATHRTAWALVRYVRDPVELRVPVAGVPVGALHSSWHAPRSEGRVHEGIDIFAKRHTRVVAAAAGEVIRIGTTDRLGGNTVWVAGAGARLYYYAHLDHFARDLHVGQVVDAGDCLGYVGTTGNAKGTPPHLHFGVYPATHLFRPVDPTPLLAATAPTTVAETRR